MTIDISIVAVCLVFIGAIHLFSQFKLKQPATWTSYWVMYTLAWLYVLNWMTNVN